MSDEIKFRRSETGHSANDLHRHGGSKAAHDEGSEREDLEKAIETLNNFEESENLKEIENNITNDVEPIQKEQIKTTKDFIDIDAILEKDAQDDIAVPVTVHKNDVRDVEPEKQPVLAEDIDERPARIELSKAEPKEEKVATKTISDETKNAWKLDEVDEPLMTIDSVKDSKTTNSKGTMLWKILAIVFLFVAIAGCGFASFILFSDGKLEILGRTVESYAEKKGETKEEAKEEPEEQKGNPERTFPGQDLGFENIDGRPLVSAARYSNNGKYIAVLTVYNSYAWRKLDTTEWKIADISGPVSCIGLDQDLAEAFAGWTLTTFNEDGTESENELVTCYTDEAGQEVITATEALEKGIYNKVEE